MRPQGNDRGASTPGEYDPQRWVSAETLWTTTEFDPDAEVTPERPNPRRIARCVNKVFDELCNHPIDVPYHDIPRVEAGEIRHCSMCREEMAA